MAIRFDEDDVRSMGRPAYGVRGMKLGEKRLHRRHGGYAESEAAEKEWQGQSELSPDRPT